MEESTKVKRSIRTTLIVGFLAVLVASQIAIGMSTYLKSESIMEETKRQSTRDMTTEVSIAINSYLEKYEFAINSTAGNKALKRIAAMPENKIILENIFKTAMDADPQILAMYMGTEDKVMYTQPKLSLGNDYNPKTRSWYIDAMASEDVIWTEPYVDQATQKLVVTVAKAIKDESGKPVGVLGADIALETMNEHTSHLKIGEKGYPIIVDKNMNIMTHKMPEKIGKPLDSEDLVKAVQSEQTEITYENVEAEVKETKFAVISKIERTGWHIVSTAYMNEIQAQINSLILLTVVCIVLAIIVSIIVVIFLMKPFMANIKRLVEAMQTARTGDLSAKTVIESKDEIGLLSAFFNATITDLGKLVSSIQGVSGELSMAAQNLAATSEEVSASADEVAKTVEDIAKGAQDQAEDAERGAVLARNLSDKFMLLNESNESMLSAANELKSANGVGVDSVAYLKDKNKETKAANVQIEKDINDLSLKTQSIESILDSISAISVQTNLLALNASIEAARAGEAGRGFAVVADEIRKLAEESARSAEQVRDIVANIKTDSERTVLSMTELKAISDAQNNAVERVFESFEKISNSYEAIASHIEDMSQSVVGLNQDKEQIVDSIENISAVSEETAAASEEVTASMDQQVYAVEEVANSAQTLNEISAELSQQISHFKVTE